MMDDGMPIDAREHDCMALRMLSSRPDDGPRRFCCICSVKVC